MADHSTWITCPMCGHSFDPAAHAACAACPLQNGCQVVCCPNCGFETVDVNQSRLARLALSLFGKKNKIALNDPEIKK